MFFWRPKERKAPARLKSSPPFLCSGVAGRHPSVKKVLPLEPFCWFLGDADLPQLVTRQGERLTSGRTYLSLNPKITRVQVVSFNGAGFSLILTLYALELAMYAYEFSLQKVIPRQRRKVTCKRAKAKLVWVFAASMSNLSNGQRWEAQRAAKHCDKQRVARCEPTEEYCSSWCWCNMWICSANRQHW